MLSLPKNFETFNEARQKSLMYELMEKIKPIHVMNLPQSKDQALAIDMWTGVKGGVPYRFV